MGFSYPESLRRGLQADRVERQSTMTAHKHLKERIRVRMEKTGES